MRPTSLVVSILLLSVVLLSPMSSARASGLGPSGEAPTRAAAGTVMGPATAAPFFPNIPVTDGSSPYGWQVEPTMQIGPSGTIYVGWKEADGADTSGRRVGYASSVDGGSTWSPNILMNQSHAGQGCANSDPWMALGPDGHLFYSYLEYECASGLSGITVANLTDGSWPATPNYLEGAGGLSDKESLSVGPTGRLYLGWDEAYLGNEMQVSWSDDQGATWSPFVHPPDGGAVLGTIIVADPVNASRVYVTWWDINTNNILFDWSGDGGATWHPDVRVNDAPGYAAPIGAWQIPIPAMNVDPASGAIYVAWPDLRNGNQDIYMARSLDRGLTWGANHKVNDDSSGHDQWMVDLAVDSAGKVHAAWEDGRSGNWNIYYANSTNGGSTWTANLKVTTEETPGSYTRPGDYFALQAGPDNTVYVVWTDGRGPDFDIYFARNPGFAAAQLSLYTNPAGLQVTLDGTTAPSPLQKTVLLGSIHTVSVPDPQSVGSATRYAWTAWSDGGSATHEVTADADLTLMASFKTQYRSRFDLVPSGPLILVDNATIRTATTLWWDAGSEHWIEAPSPQTTAADTRFLWSSWSDGGAQAHALSAVGPVDLTATFIQEHTLLVQTDPEGLTLSVDGAHVTTPATLWLPINTSHTLSLWPLQSNVPGIRYRFLSWSDGGPQNRTISFDGSMVLTARFRTEYYLTVISPVGGATGEGWYAAGMTAYATVPSAFANVSSGHRLYFRYWVGNASGTGTTSEPILMDGKKTAVAWYGDQYYLDVQSAYGTTSGSGWYSVGTTATAVLSAEVVATAPGAREHFTGWGGNASGTGVTSDAIFMDGAKVAVATWQLEYELTVQTAYGAVMGSGWHAAAGAVTVSVAPSVIDLGPGTRAIFTGWFGDASGTDPSASSPILMDQARIVVASWQVQFALLVQTEHGVASGGGWYVPGTMVTVSVNASTVELSPGTRVVFAGWGVNATGANGAHSDAILMDAPKTAVAWWTTQYAVSVLSDLPGVEGAGWYDAGARVTLTAPSQVSANGRTYDFAGWSGDRTSSENTLTFIATGPVTVQATWTVASAFDPATAAALVAVIIVVAMILALVVWRRRKREEP